MLDNYFDILKQINNQQITSQRQLVTLTNTSLGKVNKILKECIEKGFVHFGEDKPLYSLTLEGREYLRRTMKNFKQTKLHLSTDESVKIKTAVILSAGSAKDFQCPIGLLSLGSVSIIERQIILLRKYGIKDIYIVTGSDSDSYKDLMDRYHCICIKNEKYKDTGNMFSLSLLSDVIKDDFILLESDLIYEEKIIPQVLENKKRDGIVVTDLNGFGDEGFVQLSEGNIVKISKDIHQLTNIHGEMMGMSKISKELYSLMLREVNNEVNPYLSYEYVLFDLAKDYYIPYIRIEDIIWGEVDNKQQYDRVLKEVWPKIESKEFIKGEEIDEAATE